MEAQCTKLTCQMTSFFYVFPLQVTLSMKTHVLLAGHTSVSIVRSVFYGGKESRAFIICLYQCG